VARDEARNDDGKGAGQPEVNHVIAVTKEIVDQTV